MSTSTGVPRGLFRPPSRPFVRFLRLAECFDVPNLIEGIRRADSNFVFIDCRFVQRPLSRGMRDAVSHPRSFRGSNSPALCSAIFTRAVRLIRYPWQRIFTIRWRIARRNAAAENAEAIRIYGESPKDQPAVRYTDHEDHSSEISTIFLSAADRTCPMLETTYASDSYYVVTIRTVVENSFWLYRSRRWRPPIGLLIWFEPLIRNQMSISSPWPWTSTSLSLSLSLSLAFSQGKKKERYQKTR